MKYLIGGLPTGCASYSARRVIGPSTGWAITCFNIAITSRGVDMLLTDKPVGSRNRVFFSPSSLAFAFIALASWAGFSFTPRPSAGTARLSDPIIAACSRSRFDSVMPSSNRDFAPFFATSTSVLLIVDRPSSSSPLSITTSIAASLEIEAIGRSRSGLCAYTTTPVSSITSEPSACTLG